MEPLTCDPAELGKLLAEALERGRILLVLTESNERPSEELVQLGSLSVVIERRQAVVSGEPLPLTSLEFDLLVALGGRGWPVLSFKELTEKVWRCAYLGDSSHIRAAVKRLRRKIPPAAGIRIDAVRGIGYRLLLA